MEVWHTRWAIKERLGVWAAHEHLSLPLTRALKNQHSVNLRTLLSVDIKSLLKSTQWISLCTPFCWSLPLSVCLWKKVSQYHSVISVCYVVVEDANLHWQGMSGIFSQNLSKYVNMWPFKILELLLETFALTATFDGKNGYRFILLLEFYINNNKHFEYGIALSFFTTHIGSWCTWPPILEDMLL